MLDRSNIADLWKMVKTLEMLFLDWDDLMKCQGLILSLMLLASHCTDDPTEWMLYYSQ